MKKILSILAIAALPVIAFASDANKMKYQSILLPVASTNATSGAVDISAYKGNATFAGMFSASALEATATITLSHSTISTGTYVTVTNAAGTACVLTQTGPATNNVLTVPIDLARVHKYVKATVNQVGVTNTVSAFLVAPMKSE